MSSESRPGEDLGTRVSGLRSALFDLNADLMQRRTPGDASMAEVSSAVQSAANQLAVVEEALRDSESARWSQEARIVVELARTTVPAATSIAEETERWLRTLRTHGQVGDVLKDLGVQESPLETSAWPLSVFRDRRAGNAKLDRVEREAEELASLRDSGVVTTLDVLFAVMTLYRGTFDRALYSRGTSRDELIERLTQRLGVLS
jgi:hypothetical protein